MAIKFRCAYCNQLMGIARRKAGSVVTCPKCNGQVKVPIADRAEEAEAHADRPAGADAPLFERSDFDKLFEPVAEGDQPEILKTNPPGTAASEGAPLPGAWKSPADAGFDVERVDPVALPDPGAARTPGVWLSPAAATLLSVLAILALALAFGAGLLVGLFLRPAPAEASVSRRGEPVSFFSFFALRPPHALL